MSERKKSYFNAERIGNHDQAGEPAKTGIRVKVNFKCRQEFIHLPAGDSLEVSYPYSMDKLFTLERYKKYRVEVRYKGDLKCNNKRCLNVSHTIEGILADGILAGKK